MENNNKPTPVSKMVEEVVDFVNNMTYEQGQAIARAHGYGIRPNDYRSFWD